LHRVKQKNNFKKQLDTIGHTSIPSALSKIPWEKPGTAVNNVAGFET